jgi:hypothetical protein
MTGISCFQSGVMRNSPASVPNPKLESATDPRSLPCNQNEQPSETEHVATLGMMVAQPCPSCPLGVRHPSCLRLVGSAGTYPDNKFEKYEIMIKGASSYKRLWRD